MPPRFTFAPLAAATLVLALVAAIGCGPRAPAPSQTPPVVTATPEAQGPDFSRVRWRPYDSLAQGMSMPLPEDLAWKVDDRSDAWLTAEHALTSTKIAARVFTMDALMNRARCEAHARETHDLPVREGAIVIDKRRIDLPSGFDTVVEVGLLPTAPGAPIEGYVLAIGGWARKCFAYALTTKAKGKGAEEAVGDRLALFLERSFLHLKFSHDLSPSVPRERPTILNKPDP